MTQIEERADASRAFAEHRAAVTVDLRTGPALQSVDARIAASRLPGAIIKGFQSLRRDRWAVYAPAVPSADLRPLWDVLRDMPGAAMSRRGRPPKVAPGERLWDLNVAEYQTDAATFLPARFSLSCVLHFHADTGKLVVSNVNRDAPAGSLSVDCVRYEPSVRLPVLREVCFAVLTHGELERFRTLCRLDPTAWERRATHQSLQDELFFRVRGLETDPDVLRALAAARPDWESAAARFAVSRAGGWFSRALADARREERH